jgi:murein DD-endopeptidase MepM/ murein hydrolase activator NlpD
MTAKRAGDARELLALLALASAGLLTGCGDSNLIDVVPTPPHYATTFGTRGEPATLMSRWLAAAQVALAEPAEIELPYAQWGMFLGREPKASAFEFAGGEGQVLRVALARPEPIAATRVQNGKVDVDIYLLDPNAADSVRPLPLEQRATADSAFGLRYRLPVRGRYVVSVRPEPSTDALYHLTLELDPALPFPVSGRRDGVASFFGAPRDAGTRHHEGVDIFAPRMTPVVAVADGLATPRENHLGGHTVWLSTPGVSYYYAHLERAAVGDGERVRRGDVLGYVGNTGNAITTDPHLHFGVYRWGRGAVDPFPLLDARRFEEPGEDDLQIEPGATQKFLRALCATTTASRAEVPRHCGPPAPLERRASAVDAAYARAGEGAPLPALELRDLATETADKQPALAPDVVAHGAILEVAREQGARSRSCDEALIVGEPCSSKASRVMAF